MGISPWTILSMGPVVAKVFFRHYLAYSKQVKESSARSELLYDEAFWVVKEFLEKATSYTVEEVQAFCNTHVPHPPWVTVVPVVVPAETCVIAARVIVDHLGEEECRRVAGGQTWWQRRARADGGVECEWISMRKDWDGEDLKPKSKGRAKMAHEQYTQSREEKKVPPQYTPDMDESPRTMLYIHGGAHYVCSLNTHRYSIWRYARKMGGRAFGVTYRLSPQYPWPCALQDCLAAYLYLIRPPPDAKHAPVDPKRIIFAGDSAGGGLVLALLCLIRDMKLPAPACAVLISPWVDLTHSFPSILQNTATDIIMPYGFIHKPSVLWPPPDSETRSKMDEAILNVERNETPKDFEEAFKKGKKARANKRANTSSLGSTPLYTSGTNTPIEPLTQQDGGVKELEQEASQTEQPSQPESSGKQAVSQQAENKDAGKHPNESTDGKPANQNKSFDEVNDGARAEPGPVVHLEVDGKMVELKEQIQLYATNAQLTHPLVSPMLQASLGGLPPLLIIAGEKEVLRDEIIYVAHRAARPDQYPLRQELLDQQKERVKLAESYPPTDVHLQVYDGACHVIPMFSFTTPAKYCYRSIASFCVSNTTPAEELALEHTESLDGEKTNSTRIPNGVAAVNGSPAKSAVATGRRASTGDAAMDSSERHYGQRAESPEPAPQDKPDLKIKPAQNGDASGPLQKTRSWGPNRKFTHYFSQREDSRSSSNASSFSDPRKRTLKKKDLRRLRETIYTETKPFNRPSYEEHMIRERVGVTGKIRALEPEADIPALQLKPDDIGLVKEGPVKRYLEGKAIWDKRYAKTYEKIKRQREKHLQEAQRDEASRLRNRLRKVSSRKSDREEAKNRLEAGVSDLLPPNRGVWDLGDEKPPPSSIAARKDIGEALRLAKIVDEQRESMTHPIALWNEMHDLTWLTRENKRQEGEDSDLENESPSPQETRKDKGKAKENGAAPEQAAVTA